MIYRFDELYNDDLIKRSAVLFITGSTALFNRIMADRVKKSCQGEQLDLDLSAFSDWLKPGDNETSEALSFEQYLLYCNTTRVTGMWYSSVDYALLSKREKEQLKAHLKRPATNGKLVVYVMNFRDKFELLKDNTIRHGGSVNLIQLDFPRRQALNRLVKEEFQKRGVEIDRPSTELFVLRLGTYYDKYSETIDRVCNGRKQISYTEMQAELRGVTSYVLWDLTKSIVKAYNSDSMKSMKSRKAVKVLKTIIPELGEQKVLQQFKRKIDDLVELRYYINVGAIPIMVSYDLKKVRERLPKESRLQKLSDQTFRINVKLASETSLKDWLYIKMIVDNASSKRSDMEAIRGLAAAINRSAYPNERILNDIGIKNVLTEGLVELNALPAKE